MPDVGCQMSEAGSLLMLMIDVKNPIKFLFIGFSVSIFAVIGVSKV